MATPGRTPRGSRVQCTSAGGFRTRPRARGLGTVCYDGKLQKILRVTLGILLVLLGIIGLILPVMPGWVFLIPGLIILGEHFDWARRLLAWAKSKVPGRGDLKCEQAKPPAPPAPPALQ